MTERVFGRLAAIAAAFALVVTLAPLQPAAAQTPTTPPTTAGRYFADSALQRIWERNDRPVEQVQTTRSWTWGPNSTFNGLEPFKQGPNGRRLVQYFDKARMEINNPNADRDEFNFVTNGLLVREMVGGKIAVGDKPEEYEAKEPSGEAVAGDPANVNEIAPTYASFREVASLAANERPAENRVGLKVRQLIDKKSRVRDLPAEQQALADLVKDPGLRPEPQAQYPRQVLGFLTQTGAVYEGGRTIPNGSVFQPWEFVMGLPVTEPYWMQTKVAGIERYVLVQLYERRVLTYTPSNRPGFEVEMGNVGQHYYRWRYDLTDGGRTEEGARPKLDRPGAHRADNHDRADRVGERQAHDQPHGVWLDPGLRLPGWAEHRIHPHAQRPAQAPDAQHRLLLPHHLARPRGSDRRRRGPLVQDAGELT